MYLLLCIIGMYKMWLILQLICTTKKQQHLNPLSEFSDHSDV